MKVQPAEFGELICRGRTSIVGGVISYGLGTLFLLFGTFLIVGTAPMLFEEIPMAKQGGIIGVVLGAMMALFGGLLVYSYRKKQHVVAVDFHTNGVELTGGMGRRQWHYNELPHVAVAVIEPQPRTIVNLLTHFILAKFGTLLVKSYSDGTVISTSHMLFGGGMIKLIIESDKQIAVGNVSLKNAIRISEAIAASRTMADIRHYAA